MCLSKAYIDKDGNRELLMEEVASLEIEGGKVLLKTLFGEQREIGANIKEINFLTRVLVLENLSG